MFSARGLQLIQDLTGIELPSARRTRMQAARDILKYIFPLTLDSGDCRQ